MDEVGLRYYGHSAFMWVTSQGNRILIDPFRNTSEEMMPIWFLKEFPSVEVDIVLISHPHFDHDAYERVLGHPSIMRSQGLFKRDDYSIEAIPDRHAGEYGRPFNHFNLIFVVRVADIYFCHLGDNRADIPISVRSRIGKVDVLFISVDDSHHLLTYEEVDKVINFFDPKIVIPMHYLIPGLTHPDSTLKTALSWLENQDKVVGIANEEVKVSSDDLPDSRQVWYFQRCSACGAR